MAMIKFDKIFDRLNDLLITGTLIFLGGTFICIIGFFIFLMFTDLPKQETIELPTHEWKCTEFTKVMQIQNLVVGKVLIPQTSYTTVCVNYKKQG